MNKYANQYLDGLKERLSSYKPEERLGAMAAAGGGLGLATLGGGIGALAGLASDPGYDTEGRKRSRIKQSLKGLISGGLVGVGVGALAKDFQIPSK